MRRQKRKLCSKTDIFGFCIDDHPNHWKYGGGTHGRPRPTPGKPGKRPIPQPPAPDKPKRGDKPDKPEKRGRKLTKRERENLAVTYRKLPNRPTSEMTAQDIEAAQLHEAARQFEFDPSGESTNRYLQETGLEWTHLPEVSRGETGYNKGSVFQSNDGSKLRLVYTGTDTAKPSDIVADAQIASGNFKNSTHAQDAVDMYDRAQEFANRAAARPGSDVRPPIIDEINGFSLGGGTAQHVGAVKGKPTRIFNPGLGAEHVADQMSGNAPPSTDIVKTQGDPVSLLTGSLESAGSIHAGGGENPVSVRQIMPLERNKSPIEKHGGDNFHDQTAPRADPKGRSHYSKALDSAAELKDMRMLHDAIDAIEEGTSMLDWAAEHPNVTMERARTLWETARNRGSQQDLSLGGAVEMQPPSMTRAPAGSIDDEGNVIYDDRVVVPEAEETKAADRPGRSMLDELLARPTQDEVREMRRAGRIYGESFDKGVLDENLFDDLTPVEQEANNTQHLNNYHDDVAGETEDSPLLAQEESVNHMDELYRMPGEKYAHEYQDSKTPIMSPGELEGFAAQPKAQRNRMMAAKADEHAGHVKNFESEFNKTSAFDHPVVKEFGSNILAGLGLGYVGDTITDAIMEVPTEKEWAAMSDEKKMAYIHKREALGGAVTGGLGGLLGIGMGSGAAMFAPEVAIGTTAAMLGGATSRWIGSMGGGELAQAEGAGFVGGAYAGGMSHAAGKAIKAFKNRGAETEGAGEGVEGAEEAGELGEEGEALAEAGEVVEEGEALAEGAEVATTAVETGEAAAAASEAAAATAEAAATAAEVLGTAGEVAGEAAIIAAGAEEGAGIGALFAPETAGGSVLLGAAVGTVISGIGLGLHKLFG